MKLDRLMGILTLLLQNDRVTAPYLAERFEVTRRTISRDIDALCQAGIPIVTYQGIGGGISISKNFQLDKSILTTEELSNMIAALKGIGSVSEESAIQRTLEKLHASSDAVVSLCEPIIIDLASHYKGQLKEKIECIKKAIQSMNVIEFDYYYEKGDSHRRIEPYFIIFQWTSWYVFGFCLDKQDFRLFKLLRLWHLHTCEETYHPREIKKTQDYFSSYLTDQNKLVALFDTSVKFQLIETYGLDCYTDTEAGLRVEVGYTNEDFMIRWLLGFGGKVKVLEPLEIADKVQYAAKEIWMRYQET